MIGRHKMSTIHMILKTFSCADHYFYVVLNILQKITTGYISRQWLEFVVAVREKSGKFFLTTLWQPCYPIVMVASKGVTWKLWTRVNALHALVVMDASCYGRKSTRYSVAMDAWQCVPCWLWMQVKVLPRSYRRKSMCHMVVWAQVNASHGS